MDIDDSPPQVAPPVWAGRTALVVTGVLALGAVAALVIVLTVTHTPRGGGNPPHPTLTTSGTVKVGSLGDLGAILTTVEEDGVYRHFVRGIATDSIATVIGFEERDELLMLGFYDLAEEDNAYLVKLFGEYPTDIAVEFLYRREPTPTLSSTKEGFSDWLRLSNWPLSRNGYYTYTSVGLSERGGNISTSKEFCHTVGVKKLRDKVFNFTQIEDCDTTVASTSKTDAFNTTAAASVNRPPLSRQQPHEVPGCKTQVIYPPHARILRSYDSDQRYLCSTSTDNVFRWCLNPEITKEASLERRFVLDVSTNRSRYYVLLQRHTNTNLYYLSSDGEYAVCTGYAEDCYPDHILFQLHPISYRQQVFGMESKRYRQAYLLTYTRRREAAVIATGFPPHHYDQSKIIFFRA